MCIRDRTANWYRSKIRLVPVTIMATGKATPAGIMGMDMNTLAAAMEAAAAATRSVLDPIGSDSMQCTESQFHKL